jgi:hypothetical protein
MRLFRLLGVAAQAEGLRLRRTAEVTVMRAVWLAAAAVFGLVAIGLAHAAAVAWLAPDYGLAAAFGMVALADLVVAGLLALMSRRRRDPVIEEARMLRQTMLAAATSNPLRNAAALAVSAPAPVLGALAGEAVAAWLRRR